ncbi:MAG: hypothetical protein IJ487_02445, partial [Ruminococcus sp.]|nr:hypothetical protein [Ruminococcus sp.]
MFHIEQRECRSIIIPHSTLQTRKRELLSLYNDENTKIISVDIENEMKKSFLEYSMSVIVARALPDVRDGLKPVHRRIIYTMNDAGNTADKAYRKCAYTVGEVL